MTEVSSRTPQLEPSWLSRLSDQMASPKMQDLRNFLIAERKKGKKIFPRGDQYFQALNLLPFDRVRVIILGQDPYHGAGQAHGLSFSVQEGVPLPPSLQNIYKELKSDLGIEPSTSGDLSSWARQGVLLLNAVLTVEEGQPASHQGRGWEEFTDQVIKCLNDEREGLVFILWGASAQKKASFVSKERHLVISSPHPSPLSAHRGFFGSRPFSQTNAYLIQRGFEAINWGLR